MPFGACVKDDGVNFAVFSRRAQSVTLDLFDAETAKAPYDSIVFNPEKNKTGDVWHIFIKGLHAGALYLYRVAGPYVPPEGKRFNENKYLIDPYAKCLTRGSVFRSYAEQRERGLAGIENGKLSDLSNFPKCVVIDDADFDWENDKPLQTPLSETVIYELHVKGFTAAKNSGAAHAGTFRGIIEKIPYLQFLGITAIELLPIFEFDENENGNTNPRTGEKLKNYWGYSTVNFFSPKASYASNASTGGAVREFKETVRALHKAGIEVILDVVYNHTAEGNENGVTFSFRGFENDVYYVLVPGRKQYYTNYSGCGNTVNANHPAVSQFVIDSLRHWVLDMHVDGFRFDLASSLSRSETGELLQNAHLPRAIAEDPVLAKTKLIAEPWDTSAYQVGEFYGERWCEWNGKYRDDMRRFIRGDAQTATVAATRIAGSSDLYKHSNCAPVNSINFITAHDGFTMFDLVSYNRKHNEENGEENRDGSDENFSYNNGFEGASTNPKIMRSRIRKIKNFFTCLLLSQGVPMILAGDEMLRTQGGNNNAYCQDNETSYINWRSCDEHNDIVRFVKALIAMRKKYHAFRREKFFADSSELSWYDAKGKNPDWKTLDRFLAFKLDEASDGYGVNEFYFAINTDVYDVTLTLPHATGGNVWYRALDSSIEGQDSICEDGKEEFLSEQQRYVLLSDSVLLLIAKAPPVQ